ncbi:MAG: glucuronate isomerase [Ruthenibacterium sp.]
MKPFMDQDFLLSTPTAKTLYHDYAAQMPIVDYHCHISPKEMFEDRKFENITQVWLGGDHYKWRVMRSNGVDEKYITGDASDREKFGKFAEALPRAIGNPMYHWCHLELQTYFGYHGVLNADTAQTVWDLCNAKLAQADMSVRGLIAQSNVAFIGTTDDPIDSLEWHKKLAADVTMKTKVAPSFRPDKAINIHKAGWKEYIAALSKAADMPITDVASLENALGSRIAYFDTLGCRASDHGIDYIPYRPADSAAVEAIFAKAMAGASLTLAETENFQTEILLYLGRAYAKYGWAMQLHYNCLRNVNTKQFEALGPDTGYDTINTINCSAALCGFLDALQETGSLPKTILYSLNPTENELLGTIIGAYQGTEVAGKIQHGSAWWFNDTKTGMIAQLTSLANLGLLGNFVGMLTDSRSFLSYTRHAYFRRILCNLIGGWVENGEYPADMKQLGALVQDICYNNAARYFGIE